MANCPQTRTGDVETAVAALQNCNAPLMNPALLSYPGFKIPNDSQYRTVALRNVPGSLASPGPKEGAARLIEACLRARGILYQSNTGSCSAFATPSMGPGIGGQIVGLSGQGASIGIGAASTAGVISGAATFGIGTAVTVAVSAIEGIFQHHAEAVANEQKTICTIANYFNPLMAQIDAAVRNGQITPDEGIVYVRQIAQQAITGLKSILQQCNAACFYVGVLNAHIDFASYFYPILAPAPVMGAQAPGSAPSEFGVAPGGVPDAGSIAPLRSQDNPSFAYLPAGPSPVNGTAPPLMPNSNLPGVNTPDYLNSGYNQQTGQSAQNADVPNTMNWAMIGAIAAVLVAFIALLGVGG